MATFNSAQDGNWNTDATWAEAGHPTANDDVTIITHDVTYDVGVSAVTWGNCTLNSGGILIFPIAASSKMLFNATGVLTVNSGGELRAGTSGSPIGSSYLCQLHWPQGVSSRNVLILNNGGIMSIYGDPAYYGSAKTAILDSQWAAGGGLTLYVEGDYSSKWVAGQHFIIHDFAIYANYQTDAESFEIDSVGAYDAGNDKTPITVTAAGDSDTFLVGAKLWMLSRNVECLDPGSSWAVYGYGAYTERLRFDQNQDVVRDAASNVNINEAVFRGWDRCPDGGDGLTCDGTVFLNNTYGIYNNIDVRFTDCLIASCYYGIYGGSVFKESFDILACYIGDIAGTYSMNMTGDIISCSTGLSDDKKTFLDGNVWSCSRGLDGSIDNIIHGDIKKCATGLMDSDTVRMIGDIDSCGTGVSTGKHLSFIGNITNCTSTGIGMSEGHSKFKNGALSGNASDISSIASASNLISLSFEDFTIGAVKQELEIYTNAGNILCLHSGDGHWQAPPSGESFILDFAPSAYCNTRRLEWLSFSPDPLNMMFTYIASGAKTLTFKIYPVGWASSIDNDDIELEVLYFAGAGVGRTRVVNTTATYANAGWRNLEVSFTAGQDGIAYFIVNLKKYESGCYVLLDPEWAIS